MTKVLCPILSKDIDKLPSKLNKEDELRLIALAKQGNINARNQLLNTQMRQIVSVARSYANNLNSVTELVSDAVIGFDHAIDKFDLNAGVRFVTYYRFWVRDAVNRSVHENHTIRPPMNIAKTNSKTEEELAKMKGNKRRVEDKVHTSLSMSTPIGDDGKTTYEDTLRSSVNIDSEVETTLFVQKVLKSLGRNTREWKYLKFHHIDGMDLSEIGELFGVSKQAVSVNMKKTIERLRVKFN